MENNITIAIPELLAIVGLSPREDVGRFSFLDNLDAPPTSKESSKLEADGMVERTLPCSLTGDLRPG